MKSNVLLILLALASCLFADPRLSSWYKESSGSYARLFTSAATETAGTSVTTWSRGQGVQSSPTYAGISQVSHSANWVYIRTTGLATHVMGPWYLDAGKSADFPNFPSNTAKVYRIPRVPIIPATKTSTSAGTTGYYVNGVAMFDMTDTFSYSTTAGQDATPVNGIQGGGVWNREAYHNEGVTFDAGFAHQAMNQYHYHAQPPGLRHQLGDHVDYNESTNTYTEAAGLPASHSPILAWASDGLPIYGPYGYSSPLDPNSAIRRMTPGFAPRSITSRTTLPAWMARIRNTSTNLASTSYGPAVSATYQIGHYIEDYEYLGDAGQTLGVDFDLNEQNVRWCVTPEFPAGTWAYFLTIAANGTPVFPFACGRQFHGSPTGSQMTSIPEAVTIDWNGGPNLTETPASVDASSSDDVTITWNVAEGGTYSIEAADSLGAWSEIATPTATGNELAVTEADPRNDHPARFYRLSRTSLAPFDTSGFDYNDGGGGGSTSFTFNFPTTPPLPPGSDQVTITVSGLATTITTYNGTTGSVTVTFDDSSLTPGTSHTATLSFTPPGQNTIVKTSTNSYPVP